MMQTTIKQQHEWLALLEAEQARREQRVEREASRGEEEMRRLIAELDQMAERMRAAPDWVEPTEAERLASTAELNRWFKEKAIRSRSETEKNI